MQKKAPTAQIARRGFLLTLAAPAAVALLAGCHGGQGDEPLHAPVRVAPEPPPDPVPPSIARLRDFALPFGAQPAIVFRAHPESDAATHER